MCAKASVNMTDGLKYYRGTYEVPYHIGAKSSASSILA